MMDGEGRQGILIASGQLFDSFNVGHEMSLGPGYSTFKKHENHVGG
jgi:hypothetical protein